MADQRVPLLAAALLLLCAAADADTMTYMAVMNSTDTGIDTNATGTCMVTLNSNGTGSFQLTCVGLGALRPSGF